MPRAFNYDDYFDDYPPVNQGGVHANYMNNVLGGLRKMISSEDFMAVGAVGCHSHQKFGFCTAALFKGDGKSFSSTKDYPSVKKLARCLGHGLWTNYEPGEDAVLQKARAVDVLNILRCFTEAGFSAFVAAIKSNDLATFEDK
jgi:hypothetical protein